VVAEACVRVVVVLWLVRVLFGHESVIVWKRFFEHGVLSTVVYMEIEVEGVIKLSSKSNEAFS